VASGDPLADRVILWTRVTPASARAAVEVRWEVAIDPALKRTVARGVVVTGASRDFTVKVDAMGLRPATTY
jgi:alkaline phosphatase D